MEQAELDARFDHHPPTAHQVLKYETLRAEAHRFADCINNLCPESREKSLAFTDLETTLMFANAAVARRS